jgi:hypothetical protein
MHWNVTLSMGIEKKMESCECNPEEKEEEESFGKEYE